MTNTIPINDLLGDGGLTNVAVLSTDSSGNTVLVRTDGSTVLVSPSVVAANVHNPRLKHFFAGDRLSSGRMVDVVGGLTFGVANNTLSIAAPEYVSVGAAVSGVGSLSAPFDLDGSKPFFIMALYSTVGSQLAGFHFYNTGGQGKAELELWNQVNTAVDGSSSCYVWPDVADAGTQVIEGTGTPLDNDDTAVGILYTPGDDVEFMYQDATGGYVGINVSSPAATALQAPITTECSSWANGTHGIRKIYGLIVYEFDSKPTDWKAAVNEMRTNWLAGVKTPYSGW